MMNAIFGVLGATACRFFDPRVANAITHLRPADAALDAEAFEAQGLRVLYGDTDSVFVQLPARRARSAEMRRRCARASSTDIAARVRAEYRVEPQLVLELDEIYERLWLPRVRGGARGQQEALRRLRGRKAATWSASSRCAATGRRSRSACRRACSSAPSPIAIPRRSCATSWRPCKRGALRRGARLRQAHSQGPPRSLQRERAARAGGAQGRRPTRPRGPLRDRRDGRGAGDCRAARCRRASTTRTTSRR